MESTTPESALRMVIWTLESGLPVPDEDLLKAAILRASSMKPGWPCGSPTRLLVLETTAGLTPSRRVLGSTWGVRGSGGTVGECSGECR
ncbi:hypothetical protein NHF46_03820 [Arthrobacter alpinus]|nr:hypothetical protein [Arthrobacter alpinus]